MLLISDPVYLWLVLPLLIFAARVIDVSMGTVRVITSKDAASLIEALKSQGYGVTSFDGQGSTGQVKLVFSIMRRTYLKNAVEIVTKFDLSAFYTIEDVGVVEKGVLAAKPAWHSIIINGLFRPFKKGK